MNIEDFIDIYDKIPFYIDPLAYPVYRDFSNAVARDFNNSVRSIMKDFLYTMWEESWNEIDEDGSLRDYLKEEGY